MTKLDKADSIQVVQRHKTTGDLPAAMEWMARFMEVADVDFDSFQEEFDLERRGMGANGLQTVPVFISRKYPQIRTSPEGFSDAAAKLERIEEMLANQEPCLLPILTELGTLFAPVVEVTDDAIHVLRLAEEDGEQRVQAIARDELQSMHEASLAGRDLLVWGGVDAPPTIRLSLD